MKEINNHLLSATAPTKESGARMAKVRGQRAQRKNAEACSVRQRTPLLFPKAEQL